MAIVVNTKSVIKWGALAGALAAIGSVLGWGWSFAAPLAETDQLPLAGIHRLLVLSQNYDRTLQDIQRQSYIDHRAVASSNCVLFRSLAAQAEVQVTRRPYDPVARSDMNLYDGFRNQWCGAAGVPPGTP